MKKYNTLVITSMLTLCSIIAKAEDYKEKIFLNRESRIFTLENAEMPVLELVPNSNNEITLNKILKRFQANTDSGAIQTGFNENNNENTTTKNSKDAAVIVNDNWILAVYGNGTKVEYINESEFRRIKNDRAHLKKGKIDKYRLEVLGRQFIDRFLLDLLNVNSSDQIVPFHTMYEIDSRFEVSTGIETEEVTGNIVVFSRKVNGTNVIGPGSKISVMFANDETPVAFRYDWPNLVVSNRTQKIITKERFLERKGSFSMMNDNAKDIKLTRFECGYYDPGFLGRDENTMLQLSCAAFYIGDIKKSQTAVIDMIPIGEIEDLFYDPYWSEINSLLKYGEISRSSDVNGIPLKDIDEQSSY